MKTFLTFLPLDAAAAGVGWLMRGEADGLGALGSSSAL